MKIRHFRLGNIVLFSIFIFNISKAQPHSYSTQQAHSHNDYLQKSPFFTAFSLGFGSIEVDLFLKNNELYPAHEYRNIDSTKTFESLYLIPLLNVIKNKNVRFKKPLQLLIDLKTSGETLTVLQKQLKPHKKALQKAQVTIIISGEMPQPQNFAKYNKMVFFDGRFEKKYTEKQLKRIGLYSINFQEIAKWTGKKAIEKQDSLKLANYVSIAHNLGKGIRFWASPDSAISWKFLQNIGVDYIGTDTLLKLSEFLK